MSLNLDLLLIIIWCLGFSGYVATQLYWWQIKEYRLDRFRSHLTTDVGKKLFLSFPNFFKPVIFLLSFWSINFASLIFVIFYGGSFLKFFRAQIFNQTVMPKLTLRMTQTICLFMIFQSLLIIVLYVYSGLSLVTILVFADVVSSLTIGLALFSSGFTTNLYKDYLIKKARLKIQQCSDLKVIGITGSYGKTTTKEFIGQILSHNLQVLTIPGHINTDIGIAEVINQKLTPEIQVLVVEMGAYRPGEIKKICQMVKPKIGVITAIGNQHLSLFGSIENITQAKFELIDSLPADGLAILNGDDHRIVKASKKYRLKKQFYSLDHSGEMLAHNIKSSRKGLKFDLLYKNRSYPVEIQIVGKQNAGNVLATLLIGLYFQLDLKQLIHYCSELRPPESTMEVFKSENGAVLIDDSYNINPTGVKYALDSLDGFADLTKIVVLSPMLELGNQTYEEHQQVLKHALKSVDKIVWVGMDLVDLVKSFKSKYGHKVEIFKTAGSATAALKKFNNKKSVMLFEGKNTQKILEDLK